MAMLFTSDLHLGHNNVLSSRHGMSWKKLFIKLLYNISNL